MARQLKKPAKPEEPDLLPAMGLFTILIAMLLSMTAFSKLSRSARLVLYIANRLVAGRL